VLGAAFNWGMLMAWSDTTNTVPLAAWAMWLGAVTWQIGYDTMYAYTDIKDDLKLGLKSTAIRFGDQGLYWLSGFYIITMILWTWAGWSMGLGWGYFLLMAIIAAHFVWQLAIFDINKPERSFYLFKANVLTGILLIVAAYLGILTS
jgi:4-hydroxybenzoate polyprenyltransferase